MNLARSRSLSEVGSFARRAAARWRRSFVPGRLAVAEPGRLTAEPGRLAAEPGRLDGRPASCPASGAGTTCRPPLPLVRLTSALGHPQALQGAAPYGPYGFTQRRGS